MFLNCDGRSFNIYKIAKNCITDNIWDNKFAGFTWNANNYVIGLSKCPAAWAQKKTPQINNTKLCFMFAIHLCQI